MYIYTEHFLPADMNSTISTVPLDWSNKVEI